MYSIMQMLSNPKAHGKVNAVICFEDKLLDFLTLSKNVIQLFGPDTVDSSLFNIIEEQMIDSSILNAIDYKQVIAKQILSKGQESITIEHHIDMFLIQHNFFAESVLTLTGQLIIESYLRSVKTLTFLVGFELSIHIDDISTSIREKIDDTALHPIAMYEKANDIFFEKNFIVPDSDILTFESEIIGKYLRLLKGLPTGK